MKIIRSSFAIALFINLSLILVDTGHGEPVITQDIIESHFKWISSNGNYVFVKGRWKRSGGNTTFHKPPRINTVHITCDKKAMVCKEIIAMLVTPQETSWFDKPHLLIDETSYKIVDWSVDKVIRATHAAGVADFELRISIQDEFAERHWRETKARGSNTSNPSKFENWILE